MSEFRVQVYEDGVGGPETRQEAATAREAAEAVCGEPLIEDRGNAGRLRAQVTLVENGQVTRALFYRPVE